MGMALELFVQAGLLLLILEICVKSSRTHALHKVYMALMLF